MNGTRLKTKYAFGTREWASKTINLYTGCRNDCKYCYSKELAVRFQRIKPKDWTHPKRNKFTPAVKKYDGTLMFPSSHDIFPENLPEVLTMMDGLLRCGNRILVVSKPNLKCVRAMCSEFGRYKESLLFRFTIGSTRTDTLRFWEAAAPTFEERLASLKHAYLRGFQTSISCEPILDTNIDDLVVKCIPYTTDAIWFGKPNFLIRRLTTNARNDFRTIVRANKLLEELSDGYLRHIYGTYSSNPKIKWKESIKKVVGIDLQTTSGLDK